MTTKEMIFAGIGTAAVGIACVAISKVNRLCKRLNASLDDIESRTTISVSDQIIDDVVAGLVKRKTEQTVTTKVNNAVEKLYEQTEYDIKMYLVNANETARRKIDAAVTKAEPDIKAKLEREIKDVSIDRAKREVIEEAIDRAKRDLLRDLDDAKDDAIKDIERKCDDIKDELEKSIDENIDDVVEDLKAEAEDKFEEELDNLTSRYKNRLDDVSDIYASFASKIAK